MSLLQRGRRLLGNLSSDPVGFARLSVGLARARLICGARSSAPGSACWVRSSSAGAARPALATR